MDNPAMQSIMTSKLKRDANPNLTPARKQAKIDQQHRQQQQQQQQQHNSKQAQLNSKQTSSKKKNLTIETSKATSTSTSTSTSNSSNSSSNSPLPNSKQTRNKLMVSPSNNKKRGRNQTTFDPNAKTSVELLTNISSQKASILDRVETLTREYSDSPPEAPETSSNSSTSYRNSSSTSNNPTKEPSTEDLRSNIANAINLALDSQRLSVLQKVCSNSGIHTSTTEKTNIIIHSLGAAQDALNNVMDWFDELRRLDASDDVQADTSVIFNDDTPSLLQDTEESRVFLKVSLVCERERERESGGDWEFRRVFTPIYSRQYIHTNFTQLM